ncbi:hypothetical protein [Salinarimonas ramus]|uniref:Uncharacterized protein n=1 Tax=Salinarimonas ramus TaxID=690164 RepID=A0A917Q632_9HYPH|nr:hypothetical protein [Salinarimonas ramus]GGK29033.1 hypothetical protein GCM10011322_14320 [Salinarimonas ramus]
MSDPMFTKEKMLLLVREIAVLIDSDLSWIDPERRSDFVDRQRAERDEALDLVLAQEPSPEDLPEAERILRHLRARPVDAARADALESWMNLARRPQT